MDARLSRQNFLGADSEEVLGNCRLGIVGLGGGGSHIIQQLAHVGVGRFTLFDPDKVELSNLNRLVGAAMKDAERGTLKTVVASRLIKRVHPQARVDRISEDWQKNPDRLRDCDLVFGCVDTYRARDELERACRRFLVPYIDIGMDVTEASGGGYVISGQVILSMPGEPCMWCLGFLNEELLAREAELYGAAGGRPQVVWPNGVLASLAVGIFVQLVTPWRTSHRRVEYLEYDGNLQVIQHSNRLPYAMDKVCPHFPPTEVGDPFWKVT